MAGGENEIIVTGTRLQMNDFMWDFGAGGGGGGSYYGGGGFSFGGDGGGGGGGGIPLTSETDADGDGIMDDVDPEVFGEAPIIVTGTAFTPADNVAYDRAMEWANQQVASDVMLGTVLGSFIGLEALTARAVGALQAEFGLVATSGILAATSNAADEVAANFQDTLQGVYFNMAWQQYRDTGTTPQLLNEGYYGGFPDD